MIVPLVRVPRGKLHQYSGKFIRAEPNTILKQTIPMDASASSSLLHRTFIKKPVRRFVRLYRHRPPKKPSKTSSSLHPYLQAPKYDRDSKAEYRRAPREDDYDYEESESTSEDYDESHSGEEHMPDDAYYEKEANIIAEEDEPSAKDHIYDEYDSENESSNTVYDDYESDPGNEEYHEYEEPTNHISEDYYDESSDDTPHRYDEYEEIPESSASHDYEHHPSDDEAEQGTDYEESGSDGVDYYDGEESEKHKTSKGLDGEGRTHDILRSIYEHENEVEPIKHQQKPVSHKNGLKKGSNIVPQQANYDYFRSSAPGPFITNFDSFGDFSIPHFVLQ